MLRGGLAVAMLMEVEEDREVVVPWLVLPTMAPDTELDLGIDEIIAIITRPKASGSSSRFQEGRGNRLRTRQGRGRQGQDMEGGGQRRVRREGR